MSIFLIAGLAWLGFAILGWSWLVMAARADREQSQRLRQAPRATRPPYSHPRA